MSRRRKIFNRVCLALAGVCLIVGVASFWIEHGALMTPIRGNLIGVFAREGSVIGVWRKVKPDDSRWMMFQRPMLEKNEPPGAPALGFRYFGRRRLQVLGVPTWFIGGSLVLAIFARVRKPLPVPVEVPS